MGAARSTLRASRRRGSGGFLLEYSLALTVITAGVLAVAHLLGGRLNLVFLNLAHSIAGAF